jgi:hypothetical protein
MLIFNKDPNWIFRLKTANYTTPFYILTFIMSYVAGQILSSFSSFIFEGKITKKIFFRNCIHNHSEFDKKTIELFGKPFKDLNSQLLTTYCQENFPKSYDTAFVFMSIYGLSRNISMSFIILCIYIINHFGLLSFQCLITIVSIASLIRNYFRFKKYYETKINSVLSL